MAFEFDVALDETESVASKIESVKQLAKDSAYDICLEGDAASGAIKGVVVGEYMVDEQCLKVTIRKKPALLSQRVIKKTIREFFSA